MHTRIQKNTNYRAKFRYWRMPRIAVNPSLETSDADIGSSWSISKKLVRAMSIQTSNIIFSKRLFYKAAQIQLTSATFQD